MLFDIRSRDSTSVGELEAIAALSVFFLQIARGDSGDEPDVRERRDLRGQRRGDVYVNGPSSIAAGHGLRPPSP
jgi:hypothetical protein